jgi:Rieske 2Fe-2S family protein
MTAPDSGPSEKYTGLRRLEPTLPSAFYYDPAHYQLELKKIWYGNWIYLGRASTLPETRSFRTFSIGDQNILVVRDQAGALQAFHNTCRHRGSTLCAEHSGRLNANAVTCPYHNWTYNLQGTLKGVPGADLSTDLDRGALGLYGVAIAEWGGFMFVNLGNRPDELESGLRPNGGRLDSWPLASLVVGHTMRKVLACNWKVFWENFSECYHCPNLHPELSNLVPIYGRRMMGEFDDPDWEAHRENQDPRHRGGLRAGAHTWSLDGEPIGPTFPGLAAEERAAGHRYVTALPSFFVVAHTDYVRAVSMRPLGPESTEITAEWLFSPGTMSDPAFDMEKMVALGRLVIEQDGQACEWNQKGIRSIAHRQGVLMPQEYAVRNFQKWVLQSMD